MTPPAITPADAGRLARLVRRAADPIRDATLGDWLAALFIGACAMVCSDANGADLHAAIVAGVFSALGSLARIRRHRRGRRKDGHDGMVR